MKKLIFFLGLFVFAPQLSASDEGAGVTGKVDFSGGEGAHGKVILKAGNKRIAEASFDSSGLFKISGIAPGEYLAVIEASGYQTLIYKNLITISKDFETFLSVKLKKAEVVFQDMEATPSAACGGCHQAVYREFNDGEGGDMESLGFPDPNGKIVEFPEGYSKKASAERLAYVSPIVPVTINKQLAEKQDFCRSCHAPKLIEGFDFVKEGPGLRDQNRDEGVSCAVCHLRSDGSIKGKYDVEAPHATTYDPYFDRGKSAEFCAACHNHEKLAPGQQAFKEWKEDFSSKDKRTCVDCHMPPKMRHLSEIAMDKPKRAIGNHTFMGARSKTILKNAAKLKIVKKDGNTILMTVLNNKTGHSIPTGHGLRAVILRVSLLDKKGNIVKINNQDYADAAVFAVNTKPKPSPNLQPALKYGEKRDVAFELHDVPKGEYTVSAKLIFDLDRTVPNSGSYNVIYEDKKKIFVK